MGLFVKKGVPHPKNQKVLWIRALNDGRWKKKGKRLEHPKAIDDYQKILPLLKGFIKNQQIEVSNIPIFQKACEIDDSDTDVELVPEAYLNEKPIALNEIIEDMEQLMRDNIAFRIRFEKQLNEVENGSSK